MNPASLRRSLDVDDRLCTLPESLNFNSCSSLCFREIFFLQVSVAKHAFNRVIDLLCSFHLQLLQQLFAVNRILWKSAAIKHDLLCFKEQEFSQNWYSNIALAFFRSDLLVDDLDTAQVSIAILSEYQFDGATCLSS